MDQEEIIIEIARLMWRSELSIVEFYDALGVNLEKLEDSDPSEVVGLLAGVFTGWKNPPIADVAPALNATATAA